MMEIITSRLIGKTEMMLVDSNLISKDNFSNDKITLENILTLQPCTGKENGFCFYDKNNQDVLICHIGITFQRDKFEVSYGTEEPFRNKGYLTEALLGFIDFIFSKTNESMIWGLPNGVVSQHILEKCGFKYVCEENGIRWFALERSKQ